MRPEDIAEGGFNVGGIQGEIHWGQEAMGLMIGVQIINVLLLLGGLAGFVLFVMVLFKLNKALNIWLEQNERD